jgi:cytochrome c-type biogenesis protein CcmH
VAAALVAAVVLLTARVSGGPSTLDDRTMAIAAGLRCPVCSGESVAASASSAAVQMRGEIRRQLLDGRSPDEIRSWFASRYGTDVLMVPPARGLGLLAWGAPLVALLGGLLLLVRTTRAGAADDLLDPDEVPGEVPGEVPAS